MSIQNSKPGYFRISCIIYILILTGSFKWISVTATEDKQDEVINIEPSQTDIGKDTLTITDSTVDSQTLVNEHEQTLIPPLSQEVVTQAVDQTVKSLTDDIEIQPTESAAIGISTDHDSILQPSSVVPDVSKQETSQASTMESMGTTQSIYTYSDQSEEAAAEQMTEKKEEPEKILYQAVPEQVSERPEESQGQVQEMTQNLYDKGDTGLLTDSEEVPVKEGDQKLTEITPEITEQGEVVSSDSQPGPADTGKPEPADIGDKQGQTTGKPGPADIGDKQGQTTEEEEGLTFNEWTQKVLAEQEKEKHQAKDESIGVSTAKQRKKKNYASHECGAKILANNPEATNVKSVLNSNRDDYMINPCKVKKWFVAELCEPMQPINVEMASLELFSSQPKSFKVYLSDRFPSKDWKLILQKEMSEERASQNFEVESRDGYFGKFVRVELLDHYGSEHYCPLTLFRLSGIGVVDYDGDGDDTEHEDSDPADDETLSEEEDSGDSKNLFTSAKDTVLKIVKKVLNVDNIVDEVQKLNETLEKYEQNASIETNEPLNATGSGEMTLPCPPDVRIPESGQPETPPRVCEGPANPALPEVRDDIALVTKIEDHEQIETGDQSFHRKPQRKFLHEWIDTCFSCKNDTQKVSFTCSFPVMQFCIYLKLLLNNCKGQTCLQPVLTVKTEKEQEEEKEMQTSQTSSGQTCSATNTENIDKKVSETITQSDKLETSSIHKDLKQDAVIDLTAKDEITATQIDKAPKSRDEVIPDHTEVIQKSSSVEFKSKETIITTQKVLVQKSNGQDSIIMDTSFVMVSDTDSSVIDKVSDRIEPSPSVVIQTAQKDLSSQSTPSLPQSDSRIEDLPASLTVVEVDQAPTAASVVDKTPTIPGTLPVEPTVNIAVESPHKVKQEPLQDLQEQELPINGKPPVTEDVVPTVEQAVDIVDERREGKSTEEGRKKKDLDLVKVPLVPLTKRETAIMRLNNRIKTLEQNVSLSSRFLEELSKRYKKQSEDMMKLLNKTVARLNNTTLEAEIKDKLHDDALIAMESKVENLTAIVRELTLKLDTLNQQVTDRQMIWTSIEIIVFMIILIIVFRRNKTPALTQEMKEIIQTHSVPTQSVKPTYRRNSLSGPATPLKSKSDIDPGPSLLRFNSETSLVNTEYPVIEPGDLPFFTPQPKDGQKKKKKKKNKNLESKYPVGINGSNSDVALQNGGTNSVKRFGSCINSAGVLFRGENIEKLETSLQRSNEERNEKDFVDIVRAQRSDSSVSGSSSGTSVDVCDKILRGLQRTSKATGAYKGAVSKIHGLKSSGLSLDSGSKFCSDKKSKASPPLPRNEKNFVKSHKRQKSLPDTPTRVPVVETIGKIENLADNFASDNITKEKSQPVQKGQKGKGVRKSLSLTGPPKGTKSIIHTFSEGNKFSSSVKLEKGSTQQKERNVYNNCLDFSATNGFSEQDVINNSDTANDHRHSQNTGHGVGIKGSKSCYSIDPGGAAHFEQYNGYTSSKNGCLNGHSLDACSNMNKLNVSIKDGYKMDENHDFPRKDNDETSQSGWKKMIWWF